MQSFIPIRMGGALTDDARRLVYRAAYCGVALFAAAILFAGLGAIPLLSLNEARRAVPIEVMHATGDWLLPRLNAELYLAKPPLFYWCGAVLSAFAHGVNEWTLRLPSALAAASILLMVFGAARKYFDRDAALAAVIALLTCSTFVMFARRAEIDMLFAALNTAALLSAHEFIAHGRRHHLYASYTALGLAVLTKGPVALLFVPLPILLLGKRERARAYLRCARGWLLLLAIGLSWYAVVTQRLGLEVWREIIRTDLAAKIYSTHGRDSVFTYLRALPLDFLPWSLALIATSRQTWRAWTQSPPTRFLLIAAAVPLFTLTLLSEKHIKYLLPAYPAVAILIGARIAPMLRGAQVKYRRWAIAAALVLLTGYAVFYTAFERQVFEFRFSGLKTIQTLAHDFPDVPLASYKSVDMRAVYYYGRSVKILSRDEIAIAAAQPQPLLVLIENEQWVGRIDTKSWRELQRITPYISRDQTAVVLGNEAFVEKYGNATTALGEHE